MIAETYVVTTAAGPVFGFLDGFGLGRFEGLGLGLLDGLALVVGPGPSEWVGVGMEVGIPLGRAVEPLGSGATVAVGDVFATPTSTPAPPLVDVQPAASAATATHSGTADFLITNQRQIARAYRTMERYREGGPNLGKRFTGWAGARK